MTEVNLPLTDAQIVALIKERDDLLVQVVKLKAQLQPVAQMLHCAVHDKVYKPGTTCDLCDLATSTPAPAPIVGRVEGVQEDVTKTE